MLKPQIKANKPCTGYAFILSNNKSLIASNDSCDTLDAKISSYMVNASRTPQNCCSIPLHCSLMNNNKARMNTLMVGTQQVLGDARLSTKG